MSPVKQKRAPRRRLRRFVSLSLIALLVFYLGWTFLAVPHSSYSASVQALTVPTTGAVNAVAWPAYGQSAIGTAESGLLASQGAQTAVPMASITKMVLALSLMREKPFSTGEQGATLTLSQADVDIYTHYYSVGGSVTKVTSGEKISEYQAMQALLLPSANNFADSLSIWAFGSVNAYLAYANDYLSQLGLTQTHLTDASGLDPGSVSSAVNLVRIGQLALQDPVISDIVAQREATIPVAGTVYNVNSLLGSTPGVIGIKTGNSDQAGGCLLFAAKHDVDDQTVTVIGAVLGAPDLPTVLSGSRSLLLSAEANFSVHTLATKGQVIGTYRTPWGRTAQAVTADDLKTVVWNGSTTHIEAAATPISLPAHAGQVVGKVVQTGTSVTATPASVNVRLGSDLSAPSWWWRITHPHQLLLDR